MNLQALTKEQKLQIRNERIRQDFSKWTSKPHYKDATHVVEVILAEKYLPLENSTLWRIVKQTGAYKNNNNEKTTDNTFNLFTVSSSNDSTASVPHNQ